MKNKASTYRRAAVLEGKRARQEVCLTLKKTLFAGALRIGFSREPDTSQVYRAGKRGSRKGGKLLKYEDPMCIRLHRVQRRNHLMHETEFIVTSERGAAQQ